MKRLIILFGLLVIGVGVQAQYRALWFDATQYYRLGDSTVTVWGNDTLTSPAMVRAAIAIAIQDINADSANYADTSGYALNAGQSLKSDSSTYSDTATFALNGGGSVDDSTDVSRRVDTLIVDTARRHLIYSSGSNPENLRLERGTGESYIDIGQDESEGVRIRGGSDNQTLNVNPNDIIFSEGGQVWILNDGFWRRISPADTLATRSYARSLIIVDSILSSLTRTVTLDVDTLRGPNVFAKFKGFISDLFTGNRANVDTVDTKVLILGEGASKDTASSFGSFKASVESETYTRINFSDTTMIYNEGSIHYDSASKSMTFYNDISDFTWNLGREQVRRVYNRSGSTILNGTPVRQVGDTLNVIAVEPAYNTSFDSADVVGIATVDILNNSFGEVTEDGDINFLNTSSLTGDFYLGMASLIDTSPPPPLVTVRLGAVVRSDNDSGIVHIDIGDRIYNPRPQLTLYFTDSTINVTNPGIDVFALITNATNSVYIIQDTVGFSHVGDSSQVKVPGSYDLDLAFSLRNSATQTDNYKISIFVNSVEVFGLVRAVSNVTDGVNSFPFTLSLNQGDWVSIRIKNITNGTRNAVFNGGIVKMIFLGD